MLVLLKLVKPKVQLIDQNDSMVNAEDVLHVVVPVAVQEVNDDSTAKVVIQNHPKRFLLQFFITNYELIKETVSSKIFLSHSRKKKDLEPETGVQLRMNFKVKQKRLKVKLKAKRLMNQRKK